MEINNYGNIIGGNGGTGGNGGDGGRSLDNNKTGAGGNGGNGGNGGTAISGSDITINNHGRILPGSGGNEGQGEIPGGDKWQQRARL